MGPAKASGDQVQSAFRRFALLCLALIALSVAAAFALLDPIYWWWVERFESPALQKKFGFTVEQVVAAARAQLAKS